MKAGWRKTESSGLAKCSQSNNFDNIEAIVTAIPTEDLGTIETYGGDLKAPEKKLRRLGSQTCRMVQKAEEVLRPEGVSGLEDLEGPVYRAVFRLERNRVLRFIINFLSWLSTEWASGELLDGL